MIKLLAVATVCAALAGCQTMKDIDTAVQNNLPKMCSGASQIYLAFSAIASTGKIPEKYVRKADSAWAAMEVVCRDPSSVSSSTALVTAARAYAALIAASQQR